MPRQAAARDAPSDPGAAPHRGRLSPRAGFLLQTSMIGSFLAASSAPTPLYPVYQARWGFSPITVTVVFAVYALAVLAALLTVGALSDHIGRRPVLLASSLLLAAALAVFATAGGVGELTVGRVLQGLATGAASGALGAGLLDLDRARGTLANGVGPFTGLALGALGSSLLVAYLPAPTRLVYLVLCAIVLAQAVGVAAMPETAPRIPGALASLRPTIGVPAAARRDLLIAAPCLVASWALSGFYLSLGPSLARLVVDSRWVVLGGLAVFALTVTAALTVLLLRDTAARTVMFLGALGLLVGVGVTLLGADLPSTPTFFVGTTLAGIGLGAGFQGGLRVLIPLVAPHERAGLLSTVYVLCYLAFGVPAVVAGYLVTHHGLLPTARGYGLVVMALAALALLGLLTRARRPAPGA
ncbi:MFS transporter [Frankia sp. KB5]|nr:MFS transporter [Frankia sp. KB5]